MGVWEDYKKWDKWDKEGDDKAFSGTALAVRCYESHPVLKLGKGTLYGGSASYPVVKDADVYVALQSGSTSGRSSDPWESQKVVEVHYTIQDMNAPKDVERFKKLVTWICTQLQSGKKVHVGCIGGHGRTGTVLSAVVAELLEKKDAIQYVREHYCDKAVESKDQVQFLVKHYGVSEAAPTKVYGNGGTGNGSTTKSYASGNGGSLKGYYGSASKDVGAVRRLVPEGATSKTKKFEPLMTSARSLWKSKKH